MTNPSSPLETVFHNHPFDSLEATRPSPLWAESADELRDIAKDLCRAMMCGQGSHYRSVLWYDESRVRAYYGDVFSPPSLEVNRLNDRLTRAVQREGGDMLNSLMLRALHHLNQSLEGSPATLVLKGSRPISLIVGKMAREEKSISKELADEFQTLFGQGDLDAEILIDPSLSQKDFDFVHAEARLLAASAMTWLKTEMDRYGFTQHLVEVAAKVVKAATAKDTVRRSFIMQRLFRPNTTPDSTNGPTPEHVKLFSEVSRIRTSDGVKTLEETACYLSANTLHFMNGPNRPVHFSLVRCMLALKREINGRWLHAELLDISIPRLQGSQLKAKWRDLRRFGTTRVPRTKVKCYALASMYLETKESLLNTQVHKRSRRQKRLGLFRRLFLQLGDPEFITLSAET